MPKFKTDIGKGLKAPLVKYLNRDNLIRLIRIGLTHNKQLITRSAATPGKFTA